MDLELINTMNGSLEHFLTSLNGGNDTLSSFLRSWMSLDGTLQSHHEHLNQETLAYAHNLASKIDTIASEMLKLETDIDTMANELSKDLSHILDDDMENLVIRDEFPVSSGRGSTPYVKPCSQWLLSNLHNPYPPKSIRNSICRETGSSIKDLDAWFTDARKRIGWNQLRRTHFSNRREKIIDAATSFFKPSRTFLKLDPSLQDFQADRLDDYSMAFVEMEEHARRLFSDKFEETLLAQTLDHIVQDLPPLSQTQNQPNQPESQNQQAVTTLKRKRHAYPSPERSPERSLEPLPEPLTPSISAIPSPLSFSTVSYKRRRSSPEVFTDDVGPNRPQKRLREAHTQKLDDALAAASLPSPAASLNEVSSPDKNEFLLPSSITSPALPAPTLIHASTPAQPISSAKRKRCSSDSEDRRPSKYPQPAILSRIASNPLPMSGNLLHQSSVEDLLQDYLLNQSFSHDIPPSTVNEVLDDSTPVDIDYYQYPLSPDVIDNGLQTELTLHDCSIPAPVFQETIELPPSCELNTWVQGLQGYNLSDFLNAENLVYTNEFNSLLLEPNYLQFSLSSNLEEPSIPTSSMFDWMAFVNQPIDIHSASKTTPEAVLNPPNSIFTPGRQSTVMERAAKRERAELLRAELQRLEADID